MRVGVGGVVVVWVGCGWWVAGVGGWVGGWVVRGLGRALGVSTRARGQEAQDFVEELSGQLEDEARGRQGRCTCLDVGRTQQRTQPTVSVRLRVVC